MRTVYVAWMYNFHMDGLVIIGVYINKEDAIAATHDEWGNRKNECFYEACELE